jgi:hypothetical protein
MTQSQWVLAGTFAVAASLGFTSILLDTAAGLSWMLYGSN